jgi:hypothetical protein
MILFFSFSISAFAQKSALDNIQIEAMKLERMWWDQVKNVDIEGLKKTVSPHYQQVLNIGAQDRTEWLDIAKRCEGERLHNRQLKGYAIRKCPNCFIYHCYQRVY